MDGTAVVRGKDSAAPAEITFDESVSGFVIASEAGTYALRVWDAHSEGIEEFGSIDTFQYDPSWVITGTFTANLPTAGGSPKGAAAWSALTGGTFRDGQFNVRVVRHRGEEDGVYALA